MHLTSSRWALACILMASLAACARREPDEPKEPEIAGNTPRLRPLDFTPFDQALSGLNKERQAKVTTLISNSTIPDLQKAMQSREVTSEELTLVLLQRIKRYDDRYRSYIELNPLCLEEARASDRLRREGNISGPLHGIPINLKDNLDTPAPMHTTAGAELLLNHSPAREAAVVTQLRNAGAVILGKASLSELAGALTTLPPGYNAVSGIGVNPHGETFPVSGSSSGSAISTKAFLTIASIGTETSGSLISPASMNGVIGMKPSLGRVSGEGVVPLIRFQDSAGPIARHVTDAALLLGVIDQTETDYLSGLDAESLRGVSVGVLRSDVSNDGDSDHQAYWLSRIDDGLIRSGAIRRDVNEKLKDEPELLPVIFLGLSEDTLGYIRNVRPEIRSLEDLKSYNEAAPQTRIPRGQNMIDLGTRIVASVTSQDDCVSMSRLYEEAALEVRAEATELLERTFAQHQVEVLVSLSNTHSALYATAGYPAITVPLGLDPKGAPNGATFIGRLGQDARLLALAYAFEQAIRPDTKKRPGGP
jgi:amidase